MHQPDADQAIMTILEANVAPERGTELEQLFRDAAERLPGQMLHSYLVREEADPTLWRVVTIWRSREALAEYRRSVETPEGIRMFQMVGAKPELSLGTVVSVASAGE